MIAFVLALNTLSVIPVHAAITSNATNDCPTGSSSNGSSGNNSQAQSSTAENASTTQKNGLSSSESCWDEQFAAMNDILYYKPCTAEEASSNPTKGSGAGTSTGGPCGDQGYANGARNSKANKDQIWKFLKDKGLSDIAAAGIMGNMEQESAFMPDAVNSLGCSGIVQWCFGRNDQMRQWAADNGKDWTCLGTQLDFMWHEVTETGESSVMSSLNAAKTPQEAGDAWAVGYERMKPSEQAGRADRAAEIYKEYTGQSAPSSSGTQAVSSSSDNSQCNSGAGSTGNKQGDGLTTGTFGMPMDNATITECYGGGLRGGAGHYAMDWSSTSGSGAGGPVKAVDGGEVVAVSNNQAPFSGFGNTVVIKHDNGYYSRYSHLDSTAVSVGDKVSKGQQIGVEGSTGNSSGTHLDFGISKNPNVPNSSESENPLKFIQLGSGVNNAANCTADQS